MKHAIGIEAKELKDEEYSTMTQLYLGVQYGKCPYCGFDQSGEPGVSIECTGCGEEYNPDHI